MRLAVFASGGGSNFAAILGAIDAGRLPAEAAVLITDRPGVGALNLAWDRGIPTAVLPPAGYDRPFEFAGELLDVLDRHGADFVALAGYLKKVPAEVVRRFRHRMLNVHPALLPAFGGPGLYGRRVHEAVLAHGARVSGATVHLVDEEYDTGPIVLQACVPVLDADTPETLAARVLAEEHRLFPEALRLFAEGRVSVEGRRVRLSPAPSPSRDASP